MVNHIALKTYVLHEKSCIPKGKCGSVSFAVQGGSVFPPSQIFLKISKTDFGIFTWRAVQEAVFAFSKRVSESCSALGICPA